MLKTDIPFLLSGGLTNTNPTQSLGGGVSKQIIDTEIDNLFNNVTRTQSTSGYTDYRCLYISNNNLNEKLKNFSLYLHKNLAGSAVTLGLALQSEVQGLVVAGSPASGKFQLQYTLKHANATHTQTTRDINWQPDANLMAQRIAAILNSLDSLHGVLCSGQNSGTSFDFLITFGGTSTGRAQELLGVIHQEGVQVTTMFVTQGGPINSLAPNIGIPNNAPSGVTFFDSDKTTPIVVGTLFPHDFMAIWLRRVVSPNTTPIHPDSCRLHLLGDVIAI